MSRERQWCMKVRRQKVWHRPPLVFSAAQTALCGTSVKGMRVWADYEDTEGRRCRECEEIKRGEDEAASE